MTFQILSLSGGGYLGLYTASVLSMLEERLDRPLIDCFDLIAGTSVGGIIALGLAAGKSALEIRDAFIENGEKIFSAEAPQHRWPGTWIRLAKGVPSARYDATGLRNTIERIVGPGTTMDKLLKPTIVTSVNLTKGGPKVFKTGHHPRFILDWRLPIVDVALATSAAPTYFPIHKIGDELYADGGIFANSPDLIAVHEAEQFLNAERSDMRILSVGTSTTQFAFSSAGGTNLGSWGWMQEERLPAAMIGSQQALTHDMMRHSFGDRYVRIDQAQSKAQQLQLALDCASDAAKRDLQAMAASSFGKISADENLKLMLKNVAPPITFVNGVI